ncbi:hypothetical protein BDN67DRAFT_93631 [Paxillus ammoniavirescens]|nr:hypothetical protein BDN67DRAFT_93631 [Paxillus ammoniavirescens]
MRRHPGISVRPSSIPCLLVALASHVVLRILHLADSVHSAYTRNQSTCVSGSGRSVKLVAGAYPSKGVKAP